MVGIGKKYSRSCLIVAYLVPPSVMKKKVVWHCHQVTLFRGGWLGVELGTQKNRVN